MSRNWHVILRVGLAVLVVAGLLLFVLLVGQTTLEEQTSGRFTDWEALLALGAAAAAFLLLILADAANRREAYRATLRGNLIWLPGLAAVLSTALYLADIQGRTFWQQNALLLGSGLAALVWFAYPMIDRLFASAASSNTGSYLALRSRIDRLKHEASQLESTSSAVDKKVAALVDSLNEEIKELERWLAQDGEAWVSGAGYIEAWSRVQQAEVELLAQSNKPIVVSTGLYDMLRLRGSDIKDREALLAGLRLAVREIDPGADPYVDGLEILAPSNAEGWAPQYIGRLMSLRTVQESSGSLSVGTSLVAESGQIRPTVGDRAQSPPDEGGGGKVGGGGRGATDGGRGGTSSRGRSGRRGGGARR